MFFRIVGKALIHRRNRVAVAMTAVIVGAAVASAMLSVYYDAGVKMTRELRAYGANILIVPASDRTSFSDENVDRILNSSWPAEPAGVTPLFSIVALANSGKSEPVQTVLTGTWFDQLKKTSPWWDTSGNWPEDHPDDTSCIVGIELARLLGLHPGDTLTLSYPAGKDETLWPRKTVTVAGVAKTGGDEDKQVFASLSAVQTLSGMKGSVTAIAVSAVGAADDVERDVVQMNDSLDGVKAKPVRRITESEGRVLGKLRLMMLLVTLLILAAAVLSASTTLTALVIERRTEIGTMKAIGAPDSQLLSIFLAELAGMGVVGGIAGYAIGLGAAQAIGFSLFHSTTSPRLPVLLAVVLISIAVALVSGLVPIRKIRQVQPALVLRGE